MLHELLSSNRAELIRRCGEKAALRRGPGSVQKDAGKGAPAFIGQLIAILHAEHESDDARERPPHVDEGALGRSAASHGADLLARGFTIDQVVHEYGDICQAVTALALEKESPISTPEFRTLNRCLDNAIADAVKAFSEKSQTRVDRLARDFHARLEAYADEHGRLVDVAVQALAAVRSGLVGLSGATGSLLSHSLAELGALPERALSDLRRMSPLPAVDGEIKALSAVSGDSRR